MRLRKLRLLIAIAFLGIFASKMVISGAPLFVGHLDKTLMISVIMQLEVENNSDDTAKATVKFLEHKIFNRLDLAYIPIEVDCGIANSFFEHSRRYVNPYHPSIPTPPPNFI